MRNILLLLLVAALSGCISDDDPAPIDDPTTVVDESDPEAPAPVDHSCTVDVGAAVVSLSGAANVGGCTIIELGSAQTVADAQPAEFCTIEYDQDADSLSDGEVVVGATYDAGTSIMAFCQAPAMDAENTVSLLKA